MRVKIQQFEGPLDLLLQLIEEQKLDITQISLAKVTEQFLEYVRSLTELRPYELASFLVIAAKLLVIKSKALIPTLEVSPEEEEEAANLAWQLYEYKRFKEAAKYLHKLDLRGMQSWTRPAALEDKITFYPDPYVSTATLRDCMKYLAKILSEMRELPKKVLEEVVTITEKIDHLQKIISGKIETSLKELLKNAKSKTETIVTFLALLELVKQKILTVEQEAIFSDIVIKKK